MIRADGAHQLELPGAVDARDLGSAGLRELDPDRPHPAACAVEQHPPPPLDLTLP
ncbi:MAG: hypothetical protein U0R69_13530 [Gaiellales bacterium]